MTTPYQMVIANTANYIRNQSAERRDQDGGLDAFTAAQVIAIGFCKMQDEVLNDLVHFGDKPQKRAR